MNIDELREEIKKVTAPFVEKNDPAHRHEHFAEVEATALYLNELEGGIYCPKLIMLASWYHDIFAHDRDTHHIKSALYVKERSDDVLKTLNEVEITLVSDACFYHRASQRKAFPNGFSELICAADRERPMGVEAMFDRAVKWRRFHYLGWKERDILTDSLEHIRKKFGHGGTARYPDLYLKHFEDELHQLQINLKYAYISDNNQLVY